MLTIKSVLVETGDGILIEVFPSPYGFKVWTDGGIEVNHPDYQQLVSDSFKARIDKIIKEG